jgi:hypothetical protein
MTTLTMAPVLGDLLKYELNGNYSREVVTLASGTNYQRGAVLGRITASGQFRLSPATGADGSETARAVLLEPVDATAATRPGLIAARGPTIVSRNMLVYDASVNTDTLRADKRTQLVAAGIISRDTA